MEPDQMNPVNPVNPVDGIVAGLGKLTLADKMKQLTKEKEPELIEKKWKDLITDIEAVASRGQSILYTDMLSLLTPSIIYEIRKKLAQEGFRSNVSTANPSLLIISWE